MRILLSLLTLTMIVSCSTPSRFIVSDLGYEPEEFSESLIYALPRTSLKVSIEYKKTVFIPGPYADYGMKYLGIDGVLKKRAESYSIASVNIEELIEPDANHFYALNRIEGSFDKSLLTWAHDNRLIIYGDLNTRTSLKVPSVFEGKQGLIYTDVTMEPNAELKTQTIYKTVLTDTSFLNVPVTSEQMERKTIEKKAEEAAKLILDIRSDRYYLAAGMLDPYPVNFDIETAIKALDKLEREYLSLFIGKSFTENQLKEYFVVPSGNLTRELIDLDKFSSAKGINAEGGEAVSIAIKPEGSAGSFRNLMPQDIEADSYNRFYYRIPEICEVEVMKADKTLYKERLSIYQSGALVNMKVSE